MYELFVVDAFVTKYPFSGNPASVCILDCWKSDIWMQAVANEMNHSETAFVLEHKNGFAIRYFTPNTEVPLCGHATLASAFILWKEGVIAQSEAIVFYAKGGTLKLKKEKDIIQMDFPTSSFQEVKYPDQTALNALSINPLSVFKSEKDIVFELKNESEIENYKPDFHSMKLLPYRMIILTAQSELPNIDFVSRVFAPSSGIDEDPATGIAICILGPFWSQKLSKTRLRAFQASSRGADFDVFVQDQRVFLSGRATMVLKGRLYV